LFSKKTDENLAQRKAQLKALKSWEQHINSISKGAAHVSVENEVDLDGPPSQMTYITESKAAPGIIIPDDPPMGCECKRESLHLGRKLTVYNTSRYM